MDSTRPILAPDFIPTTMRIHPESNNAMGMELRLRMEVLLVGEDGRCSFREGRSRSLRSIALNRSNVNIGKMAPCLNLQRRSQGRRGEADLASLSRPILANTLRTKESDCFRRALAARGLIFSQPSSWPSAPSTQPRSSRGLQDSTHLSSSRVWRLGIWQSLSMRLST